MKVLQPEGWPRPRGYSNGIAARGEMVFLAGVVGWDSQEYFPRGLVAQFRQALTNIVAILAEAGARPDHVVRMTWFITSREDYLAHGLEIGAVYREIMGKHFPVMAVVQVVALIEEEAEVEIEVTAVIPD
ncbi:MAG: RidA family protein [Alphaproteobacteria bacterium]|nr:RidA family protein [Alphaproteobacteria bacterium]